MALLTPEQLARFWNLSVCVCVSGSGASPDCPLCLLIRFAKALTLYGFMKFAKSCPDIKLVEPAGQLRIGSAKFASKCRGGAFYVTWPEENPLPPGFIIRDYAPAEEDDTATEGESVDIYDDMPELERESSWGQSCP